MRRAMILCLLLAAAMTPAREAPAAEQVVKGFETFKLVRTRNMFDPNRQPIRTESGPPRPPESPAPPAPKQLTLNGAMVTADKSLAFFGGTQNDYRKVLGAGETIAGFQIKNISPSQVELERGGKTVTLFVGQQISPDAETPTPTAQAQAPSEETQPAAPIGGAPAPGAAAPASGAPAAPGASPGALPDRNELLRRMMQRRQQETSR